MFISSVTLFSSVTGGFPVALFLETLRMNIEAEWEIPSQAAFWDDAKLKTCDSVSPAGK